MIIIAMEEAAFLTPMHASSVASKSRINSAGGVSKEAMKLSTMASWAAQAQER
jgi:hypothetical protein